MNKVGASSREPLVEVQQLQVSFAEVGRFLGSRANKVFLATCGPYSENHLRIQDDRPLRYPQGGAAHLDEGCTGWHQFVGRKKTPSKVCGSTWEWDVWYRYMS